MINSYINALQFYVTDPFVEPSDVLHTATMIAEKGYNIKQCTVQIEIYREIERDSIIVNHTTTKTHSIGSETDNSIINILTWKNQITRTQSNTKTQNVA